MKTKEEIIQKTKSVKLCLMAHPDNEQDSEFEDRISDLEEIENYLSKDNWIKLELGSDLPKMKCDLWVLNNGKVFYYSDFEPNNECCQRYIIDNYTHYQPIIKPQPPIH